MSSTTLTITVAVSTELWAEEYDLPVDQVGEDAGRYLAYAIGSTYAAGENLVEVLGVTWA